MRVLQTVPHFTKPSKADALSRWLASNQPRGLQACITQAQQSNRLKTEETKVNRRQNSNKPALVYWLAANNTYSTNDRQ